MQKKTILYIDGMTCGSCEKRIERALSVLEGVEEVKASFNDSKVEISYLDDLLYPQRFIQVVEGLGYGVKEKSNRGLKSIAPLVITLFGIYYIIQNTIGFNFIPEVSDEMGYGLLFLVGILTSVHCVAMCGGIAISQGISEVQQKNLMPSFQYNIGRLISYTIIGGIVGGLGAIITPSGQFKGIIAVGAGVFMVMMGIKMLNIFRLPQWMKLSIPIKLHKKEKTTNNKPLIVGLFNGLMPCGPLQTMQLYALGTGSIIQGALSMFFFSLGTIPLLFIFSAIASVINGKLSRSMMKVSAGLVIVLGVVMLNRGLALSGLALDLGFLKNIQATTPEIKIENGKQIVNMVVEGNRYIPDVPIVQAGIPVKMTFKAKNINGCNNPIIIPEYGIEIDLKKTSEAVVEFTPTKEGTIRISCWMGMITTKLSSVEDPTKENGKNLVENNEDFSEEEYALPENDYSPVPIENIAEIAKVSGDIQTIETNVDSYGYSPNILVVQKGIDTRWVINTDELNFCNYIFAIPDADFYIELKEGENEIRFKPERTGEITFTCGMNMLGGKVIIVDDLDEVNLEALERSVIIPSGGGASCH